MTLKNSNTRNPGRVFGRAVQASGNAANSPAVVELASKRASASQQDNRRPATANGASTSDKASVVRFGQKVGQPLAPANRSAPEKKVAAPDPLLKTKRKIHGEVMDALDLGKAAALSRKELEPQLANLVEEVLAENKIACNRAEQIELVNRLLNDMIGLGPLEALLADDTVTDIMVNGADQVYIERNGITELTDVTFADDAEVMNIAVRIATRVGRRIDETRPLVDARLKDGSRVNIIVPPLALDGPSISIRKFSRDKLNLERMASAGSISHQIGRFLQVAGACRLNIVITGGTGSGKTTMLNAISEVIDKRERIVTIEDAAELQLQQPHVVRLETRPANIEGKHEITMRDLLRNSLRMRPDRIIVGEVRGEEVIDMLQAMNTGHEGSLGTVHANSPRHAITRLENLFAMSGTNLSGKAVRTQIAEAVDLIVHVSRMRDGVRRVTRITEIVGMEGDVVLTQDLFTFEYQDEGKDGKIRGQFVSTGIKPRFTEKARYFGLEQELVDIINRMTIADAA